MNGPDILREVDESLRAEKAAKFWKNNGNYILMIVAALILGTAAQSIWTAYKKGQDEATTTQFLEALKAKDPIPDLDKLNKEGKGSGSALAGLSSASMLIEKKEWNAAITTYQNLISNKSVAQDYKDLAAVQLAALQLDHDEKATGSDILKTLDTALKNKNSAWYTKALLLSALTKAQKNNDLKGAMADLDILLGQTNLSPSFLDQVKSLNEVFKMKSGS